MSIDINEIRTQYKDLFEHSLDIIYVNRLDGKIIDANAIALSTLGYKREEIIDFSFGDLIDKDQLENANSAFKEIKETGQQSKLFEFRLKAKDGSFVYIETYAIPLQKNGKIYATLGIARNITDLRVVQENLKQSEEKYRFLYETTPFSVVLLNSDGIIVDCNPTTETMFGFNKIELIGRHFKNISVIHQDYLPELFNLFQRIIKGEDLHRIDIQMYKADGSLIWANLQASILMIGGKLFVQAIFHDVTESKEITQKLEESEILYKTLVKTSPDAVIVTDMKGEIIEASQKAAELDRASSVNDIIGRNAFNLIIPEERPKAMESLKKVLKEGSIKTEYTLIRSDGSQYIGELNTSLIKNKDGTPKAFIGIMRDITEQKNAEKLLKESEEKYRDLYENALVGLWTIRIKDGAVIRANNVSAKMAGYNSVEDLIRNFKIFNFFEPKVINEIYGKFKQHGEISGLETQFKDIKGNEKIISIWGKLYKKQGYIEGVFIDITNLKKVQKALQESEEKYRYLFENSPNMITLLDSAGKIIDLNPTVLNYYGYEKKDFIDQDFRDLTTFPSENLPILEKIFKRVFIKGFTEPIELQFYNKDGSRTWVNLQASLIKMGGETFIQTIVQDIDKRKRAEHKLRESEEKYRHLFENSPNMIILLDSNGRVLDANTPFLNIFDYKEDDVIGKNFQQLENMPLKNLSIYQEKFKNIFNEGVLEPFEIQVLIKDDILWWMNVQASLIDIEGKKLLQVIFQDINEQKEAEQKLKESETKYRLITDNANDLISVINENFRHEYINEEVHKKITGYSNEDLIGKLPVKNVHPEDIKKVVRTWRSGAISGEGTVEVRYKNKDGSWIWLDIRGKRFIGFKGKPKVIIISRDITERKIAELRLKESEEKYRIITENANDLISVVNEKFRFEYINEDVHKRITGYSNEDLIGKSPLNNFHPDDIKKTVKTWRDAVISGEGMTEFRYKKKDGTWIWLEMRGKKFIDTNGEPKGIIISRDITKRKIAEQKLKESEQKFRTIAEQSLMGIIILQDNLIKYINEEAASMLDYTVDEVLNMAQGGFINYFHPDDRKIVIEQAKKRQKGIETKISGYRARCLKKSGEIVWIQTYSKTIKYQEKYADLITVINITDKVKAEEKLKESEQKYRHLFESSPYSIGLLDLEGTLLEGNEATNKFLSTRTKDEIIGKNIREIFSSTEQDKSLLPKLTDYFKKVIKDEIREPLEIPITRSIGGVIWISFYGSLIKMGDKTLLQFLGLDITDRKRAEQNLKKSEERYRLLFENSPNAIILANSKGIILDFNPATKNLLGYKRDEIIGTNYVNISSPSHIALMKKRYDDHLRGILLKPMEIEVRKIDGSYIWVNYQNEIIRFDEEDISISIIQDITKRKEAELLIKEELIKLKELEQIRKDLISRVSHELKTPLIPVISGTELLTTIYKDQLGKDALEIIDMIDKGGARLKELVEKLINVSRIEYNKFEVRKETFNLSEIIKRSANGMKFLMEQRRLILKCEISDKLYLEIDELRMEEVITNLLSNAIKNTPPQGEINLSLQKEDNWAIIKVEDTGIGLTKKEKEILFTRFGKIERYEKGLEDIDIKGSGLGLYICKEIISLHEGKIWAESEGRNKGSVFTVKLPIK